MSYKECPVFVRHLDNGLPQGLNAVELLQLARTGTYPLYLTFSNSPTFANEIALEFRPNLDYLPKSSPKGGFSHGSQSNLPLTLRHCHFKSTHPSESKEYSTLSVCNKKDINGLIRINGHQFVFGNAGGHFYFLTETSSNCDWHNSRRRRSPGERRDNPISKLPEYYPEYIDGTRRWLELVFIADHTIFKKYEDDEQRIHDRLHSVASTVNALYAPLNIRVTLVWADVWKKENPIEVTEDADKTLRDFLGFRKSLLAEHSHDNAHLLTDVRFGAVIGKAYKGTMCSFDYSGGVIVDHSENPVFVGMTVAHEMGHNFGMDHDVENCNCPLSSCIMAPASSSINATAFFSDCSLDTLSSALRRGVDYCLRNVPKAAFGGAKCGNGILEDGEDCDCGSTTMCPNKCCIAAECKLAPGAACADGDCCDLDQCALKTAATVCRQANNICDLPEFCDGKNPSCPADFFVQDGHHCPDEPEDRCYDGVCGSRRQQCRFIWGPSAENSVPECYAYNEYGSFSGNCGYNQTNEQYLRCKAQDVSCGRLQCVHQSDKPVFGDPSTVYSAYNFVKKPDGKEEICRVIRTTFTGTGNRKPDPGMVPDGAKCGKERICVNAECRNQTEVLQMVSKCEPEDCNGKGMCNNVGNCHCVNGYGGVSCDLPGYGGSVNSGPANDSVYNPGLTLLYFLAFMLIAFVVATVYCRRKKGFWLHKKVWSKARVALELRSFNLHPIRRAPPPPGSAIRHTHRQSWNAVWEDPSPQQTAHGEILCVDASRPYAQGGARATLKQQRQSQAPQPVETKMIFPGKKGTTTTTNSNGVAHMKPGQPFGGASVKTVARAMDEQRALVPGDYDTGRSSSSEDSEHKNRVNMEAANVAKPPPVPPHSSRSTSTPPPKQQSKPAVPKKPVGIKADERGKDSDGTGDNSSTKVSVKAMAAKFEKK